MAPFDIERARRDTPGCHGVVHLNNAGSSLPPAPVVEAVIGYLQRESITGGYELGDAEAERIERYRHAFAEMVSARSDEVAFAVSDTAAWSSAFWGLLHTGALPFGSRVLVDRGSYASHYLSLLQAAQVNGLRVEVILADPSGAVDVSALRDLLDTDVSMVSLTHVGTHRGLVNPVEEAGRAIAGSGALYLLDACQSLGQLPVDVRAIGCDVLTGTGRKFLRGPRGTGILWTRHDLIERIDPPGVDGHCAQHLDGQGYALHPDARRFEPFEASMACKVGLGVAVDYAMSWGLPAIHERIDGLSEGLRELLGHIGGVTVLDGGARRSGIVTFRCEALGAGEVKSRLAAEGINVSVTGSGSAPLDMNDRGVPEAVRASIHYYNTDDELQRLADSVSSLASPG